MKVVVVLLSLLFSGLFSLSAFAINDPAENASVAILKQLEQGKIKEAERLAKQLTQKHPDFRLGHMLYADIQSIKQGKNPNDVQLASNGEFNLSNLRNEAARRWQHELYPPPKGALPSSIAKLSPRQDYAVVNDLKRSRMYVFKNELGEPRLIANHYIGIGKFGYGKQVEGDHKTPLGVYSTTSFIPDDKLPDLYGAGAYPLNYPNHWDQLKQRTGHGIWIHGVPSAHYNRPPLSSEGCITMNNAAFNTLADIAFSQQVTVVNVEEMNWLSGSDWNKRQEALLGKLAQWESDWESLDTEAYLTHYGNSFTNGEKNIDDWRSHKRRVNQYKTYIELNLSNVSMFEYGGEDGVLQVNFEQKYKSDNLSGSSKKTQLWKEQNGDWKIIYEGKPI